MVRPKTDSERRYEAAQARLTDAEKAARAAEKITAGHPTKIEAKRRRLRDLSNTMFHADGEQNSRANRGEKKSDIERDIAILESELSQAQTALSSARSEIQSATQEASQAGAAFTIERDRMMLDDAAAKRELDQERFELEKSKFALAEREKLDAAKTQLAIAEKQGASALELERYKANVTAAALKFEWQQKREIAAIEAENRASEITQTNQGNLELAQLQGELAERAATLSHEQALEVIDANTVADIRRAVAHGEVHRQNVTHEVNEDIRKAWEMLTINTQKGISDTLNAAKLLVLKHHLEKDRMTHALTIAQEAKAEELDGVAADMAEIARWNANHKPTQTDFEDKTD